MSDGPKFTINSADVPAANRIRISADETMSTGTFRIESTDGTRWHVVGVDFGYEPSHSVVSTTCARCSATIDPAAVEQHHERCFVVGDLVRYDSPVGGNAWAEGRIVGPSSEPRFPDWWCILVDRAGGGLDGWVQLKKSFGPTALRHIQRPGQAVREPTMCCICGKRGTVSWECDHGKAGPPTIETPYVKVTGVSWRPITVTKIELIEATKYDGLTGKECLERYEAQQREQPIRAKPGERIFLPLTPVQLAAARDLWSQHLKQRISAAKERERLSVTYCEVDVEDEPW